MAEMPSTIPTFEQPEPCRFGKESISQIAEKIAVGVDRGSSATAIRDIVSAFGGKIELTDFWGKGSGQAESLRVDGVGDFRIFVSTNTIVERDNFTIAHEFGHYILHYLWPVQGKVKSFSDPLIAYRVGSKEAHPLTEWEANCFAAAILMPESKFREKFKEFGISREGKDYSQSAVLLSVANHFEVTRIATEFRAKNLGMIN